MRIKLDIIASVGSGKTTLARMLSEEYAIPWHELDNVMWMRTTCGDVRRPEAERTTLFEQLLLGPSWIIEGSPRKAFTSGFDACDIILFLDVPASVRCRRIFGRWVRQCLGKEAFNTKPTLHGLFQMFRWHRDFERNRPEFLRQLRTYGEKFVRVHSTEEAQAFIRDWIQQNEEG